MSKALFFGLPLHGHTNPSLPLVRELADRGAEIVYYSSDAFAEKIKAAGARPAAYRIPFLRDMGGLPDRMEELGFLLVNAIKDVLKEELGQVRREKPDYIIHDSVAPWGKCIAEILGVPAVTSVSTFAFNRHVLAFGIGRGVRPKSLSAFLNKLRHVWKAMRLRRQICRAHNLRGLRVMDVLCGRSGLNLVYTSKHFQPRADTFDASYHFIGPSMAARTESAPFPWEKLRHPTVIYVSLGTLFNAGEAFYRACFDALGGLDCQVVLATGNRVSNDLASAAPKNFLVERYVPQLEILPRTTAFISHAGMNSASESLYFGVPLLVVPHIGEQMLVGRRLEQLGAGICLRTDQVTVHALRANVQRILSDPSFRAASQRLGASFRSAGGVKHAADLIAAYVDANGPSMH